VPAVDAWSAASWGQTSGGGAAAAASPQERPSGSSACEPHAAALGASPLTATVVNAHAATLAAGLAARRGQLATRPRVRGVRGGERGVCRRGSQQLVRCGGGRTRVGPLSLHRAARKA
jgi:hypothetical protein